jgi:hypothetical protein
MHDKRSIMLRLLLNRFHGGKFDGLLKTLPEEDREKIISVPIESGDVSLILEQAYEGLNRIHYSWLIAPLEKIEKKKLPLVISILPEHHAAKLRKHFNDKTQPLNLTPKMKYFLFSQLYHLVKIDTVLPLDYLPQSEMTSLTALDKNSLVELIDFLGLFDLGEEIHHIVDKNLLEQIYTALTKKEHVFLRLCLHQKEKLVTQRLQLESWDGNPVKLHKLLHHKGTIRLGYALSGEQPELLWHICHILDIGRGDKLSRFTSKDPIPGVTDTLRKQVKSILKFFKQASEK